MAWGLRWHSLVVVELVALGLKERPGDSSCILKMTKNHGVEFYQCTESDLRVLKMFMSKDFPFFLRDYK